MENQTEIYSEILRQFLDRWSVDKVRQMTLEQYVSVGDKDTFCQWLETRTRQLGSINGLPSWKFGIWKRGDKSNLPQKNYYYDENYSWQKVFGHGRDEAFKNIKGEILQIIDHAERGHFRRIDALHLTQFVKWKIAYLYSGERLIPIFNNGILAKIAADFGLSGNLPYPEIQEEMIARKPVHIKPHQYMLKLCDKFGGGPKEKAESGERIRRTTRQAAAEKNIGTQTRRGAATYVATQKHNILQEALKQKLEAKYGKKNVLMEENNVDLKVLQPEKIYFYEVKSSAYASDCIREALGQILSYAHIDSDSRPKQLIVAGQYKPNDKEIEFINFVKKTLNLNFSYENIDLV